MTSGGLWGYCCVLEPVFSHGAEQSFGSPFLSRVTEIGLVRLLVTGERRLEEKSTENQNSPGMPDGFQFADASNGSNEATIPKKIDRP